MLGFPLDEMIVLQHLATKVLAEVTPLDRGISSFESVGLSVVDNYDAGISSAVIGSVRCDCAVNVIRS